MGAFSEPALLRKDNDARLVRQRPGVRQPSAASSATSSKAAEGCRSPEPGGDFGGPAI